jgi:hypothetical protein
VGGRVRRSQIEDHRLAGILILGSEAFGEQLPAQIEFVEERLGLRAPVSLEDVVVLAERMADELVVIEDPLEVRVRVEDDTVLVERLPLCPVGCVPEVGRGRNPGILLLDAALHRDAALRLEVVEEVDQLEPFGFAEIESVDNGDLGKLMHPEVRFIAEELECLEERFSLDANTGQGRERRLLDQSCLDSLA